jgi:integrase
MASKKQEERAEGSPPATRAQRRRGSGEGSIYQTADGRWRAVADLGWMDGKRVRKYISAPTQGEVLRKLREAQRAAEAGVVGDGRATVTDLATWWLGTVAPAQVDSPITLGHYRTIVERHIIPGLGHVRLDQLRADTVDRWLAKRSHLSRTYVARMRSTLAQMLRHAERWGLLVRNVATLAVLPRAKPPAERRSLTPAEARRLIEVARGDRLGALVVCGLALGLRPGELTGLLWRDVNLDGDSPTVAISGSMKRAVNGALFRGDVKRSTAGRRTLALPPVAAGALWHHRRAQAAERLAAGPGWQDGGYVFTTTIGTPLDPTNLRRAFDVLTTAAGIERVSPYVLRHSGASLMLDAGASLEEVADVLGDHPATLLRHYRHRVRPVAEATKRMQAVLEGAG